MEVTLSATGDSLTSAALDPVVFEGYEEDKSQDAKVIECLHISNLMEKAGQFDLIHNHFDFLPLTYSRLIQTPLITTIHGFSSEKILAVYKKYDVSAHYVAISDANRHPDLSYLGTVYNGLRTEDFTFTAVPDDYLLFFGRIHPDKGAAEAIQIALRSNRRLLIAGIIQDEAYYAERVKPYLNEQIVFMGSAGPEQRNELLGKAAALLHPISFAEPFGLSVAEAMLCGTPVIAYDKGAMPELILNEKTGFLVKNIAEAVEAVGNISLLNRQHCREWSATRFSKEKMVADYLSLYRQIL
jgi:glycosyltransferase involved in cell wall biosynthesis